MIAFKVTVEFGWGFINRVVGLSKSSPSFFYPPPTTFLGALASVISKEHFFSENEGKDIIIELSKNLLSLNLKPENCIPLRYSDINKIIAIKETSGVQYPDPGNLTRSFDSPARGKTILVSLFGKDPPRLTWLVIFNEKSIFIRNKEIKLNKELFWRINRIGAKESIVSVIDVEEIEGVKKSFGKVFTKYSFPNILSMDEVEEIGREGEWLVERYINPFNIDHYNPLQQYIAGENLLDFYLPTILRGEPSFLLNISPNSSFCRYDVNDIEVIGRCLT